MYLIFPTHCMACPSGLMVGMKNEKKDILCVVAVVTPSQAEQLESKELSVLGLWYSYDDISEERKLGEPSTLVLFLPRGEKRPRVLSRSDEVIIVLYNHRSTSTILTIHPLSLRNVDEGDSTGIDSEEQALLPLPDKNTDSCVEEITNYINMVQDPKIQTFIIVNKGHVQELILRFLYWVFLLPSFLFGLIASVSRFLMSIMSHAVFKSKVIRYLLSLSVLFKQFSSRLKQITAADKQVMPYSSNYMLCDNQEHRMNMKRYLHERQRTFIIKGNLITIIALDVILGVTIVTWLTLTNVIPDMASYLLQNTENIAQMLIKLIQWLMGVPAGLKLNKTLTSFLGKFFLYHIYLWQTYLKVIQPYLQTLLWTCILSGCFGMTFLISLASDILSLLTLHIYCFYVYAARLYSLQVYTLLSLARLFTGKKWNVLRSRVDSLPHDVDRLFVGTLLFTVLLFLLPTTALFYVVFTSIRLLVYVVKYLLSCATHLVNKMPLFGLLLLFFQPSLLPGGLHLEILENLSDQPTALPNFVQPSPPLSPAVSVLYLKLTNKPLSIAQLRNWSIDAGHETDDEQDTWGTFVGKLLRGLLVYPWIKRS